MVAWSELDFNPDQQPPEEETAPDFEAIYVRDSPWRVWPDGRIFVYQHPLFIGRIVTEGMDTNRRLVVRQSREIFARHQENPLQIPLAKTLLIASQEGETVVEWGAKDAVWVDESELVIGMLRQQQTAELRLSRQGGVLLTQGEPKPGWLIGQDAFAHEIPFL